MTIRECVGLKPSLCQPPLFVPTLMDKFSQFFLDATTSNLPFAAQEVREAEKVVSQKPSSVSFLPGPRGWVPTQ